MNHSPDNPYKDLILACLATGVAAREPLKREAFAAVADALDAAGHDGLIEIEIMKSNLFREREWVLKDGNAVAINETGLRLAFFEAHNQFHDCVRKIKSADDYKDAEFIAVLNVYNLLHPEHQQAAHWRKEIIKEREAYLGGVMRHVPEFETLIRRERRFIDSLLTSPLNRNNKSPTLWAHRRWLASYLVRWGMLDVLRDLTEVVMVSGERHPRNYYAWNHARYLMTLVDWAAETPKKDILQAVMDWCSRHHDDTSGWSFLQTLLLTDGRYEPEAASDVFREILDLAGSLGWTNESVWVFLRTMVTSTRLGEADYDKFRNTCSQLVQSCKDETARRVLQAAAAWGKDYRQPSREAHT